MLVEGKAQSILLTGESGLGETETVKILMRHLVMLSSNGGCADFGENVVVRRILDSNPLLEAFGNAKTLLHDNLSRFGKLIEFQFRKDTSHSKMVQLVGSKCATYLLEKSPVVWHDSAWERGYHIFYQLLAAPKQFKVSVWDKLEKATASTFRYLSCQGATSRECDKMESNSYRQSRRWKILGFLERNKYL